MRLILVLVAAALTAAGCDGQSSRESPEREAPLSAPEPFRPSGPAARERRSEPTPAPIAIPADQNPDQADLAAAYKTAQEKLGARGRDETRPQIEGAPAGDGPCDSITGINRDGCLMANEIRRNNGLPEMRVHPALMRSAQAHAEDMVRYRYFEHEREGWTLMGRIDQSGGRFNGVGENIAMGQRSLNEVFRDWWNSPEHRAGLLNGDYRWQGFVYYEGHWVHDFGQ